MEKNSKRKEYNVKNCEFRGGGTFQGLISHHPFSCENLEKCYTSDMKNHFKSIKKGFTLAEVLITLGVIGVVAALTLPSVIANYQKKQTVVQLKQAYSILANAVDHSIAKNGDPDSWEYSSPDNPNDWGNNAKNFYFNYLDEFLNVSYYCGIKHTEPRKGACSKIFTHGDGYAYSVILNNGIGLTIRTDPSDSQVEVQLDVNGVKGPNRAGRDAFMYRINKQEGLIPVRDDLYGMKPCTRTLSNPNGFTNWIGWGCAYVIMQNGWDMPKDYPWNDL